MEGCLSKLENVKKAKLITVSKRQNGAIIQSFRFHPEYTLFSFINREAFRLWV